MGYRLGRLSRRFLDRLSFEHEPNAEFVRPFRGKNNCTWFAIDGKNQSAHVVHFRDGYPESVLWLCERLEGSEAVLVVSEPEWNRWTRENIELGADEDALGDAGYPIAMVWQMAFCLIVPGKVSIVDEPPAGTTDPRVEYLTRPGLGIRIAQSSN